MAQYFTIPNSQVARCSSCGGQISWQKSRRGSFYPTEVFAQNGELVTSRTVFHKCNQTMKDATRRASFEEAGQAQLPGMERKLDMTGVNRLFDKAVASGLKYPKIRLQTPSGQPVVLSRAGDRSKYKGQVMVTDGQPYGFSKYFGRVDEIGTFHQVGVHPEICTLLEQLGSDPAKVASQYGKLTGNCCFCMKRLEDQRSTEVGYGPVCAKKFGLPWG